MGDLTYSESEIKDLLERNPDITTDERQRPVVKPAARSSKYGNKKTAFKGVIYDSAKEARRAQELDLMLAAGDIDWCVRQAAFVLPGGVQYFCDFEYGRKVSMSKGKPIYDITFEDVKSKGTRTKEYRIKKKQVEALFHIVIKEV
jgi:hypothetical protein